MPDNGRKVAGALLGLHAQTALHPGAGTALGTVDLPVQRERHTHWPTIAGSALKGVLRDGWRERIKDQYPDDGDEVPPEQRRKSRRKANEDDAWLTTVFGPGRIDESNAHAGALSVTDARLLAFPVRSLKGVFAWVSCPTALERLKRDATLAGLTTDWSAQVPARDQLIVPSQDCPCLIDGIHVVLEEFEFTRGGENPAIARWIATHLLPADPSYADTVRRFQRQFLILTDDDFTHFARHATEVTARIGLNYETKTVREGALFYQEFLPTETLLYAVVLANGSRARQADGKDGPSVLGKLAELLPPVLQVGGDETIGKGLCSVRLFRKEP